MPEQFNLPFHKAPQPTPTWETIKEAELLNKYSTEELRALYKTTVGITPKNSCSDEKLAWGILHPDKEKTNRYHEDRAEDHDETEQLYRRKSSDSE